MSYVRASNKRYLEMTNRFIRLLLTFVAILALVTVSTAAVAHGHLDANSADESHCPLCLALHSAKQAVVAPVVALSFTQVQAGILVPANGSAVAFVQPRLTQDRAPPPL